MAKEPLERYQYQEKLELKDLNTQFPKVHKINCPSCAQSIPADNLNVQNSIAKCGNCEGVFSFANQIGQLTQPDLITEEILKPEGVELHYFQDDLDISVQQPWSTLEIIFVSLFPFLILIATGIIIKQIPPSLLARIAVITFWIISFISYIAYFFLRKRHKLYIHIDDEYLHIERRPHKLIKDKQFLIKEIDQVYIKSVGTSNGIEGVGVFMIVNSTKGQKHVKLVPLVSSRSKAKYIEQEIEKKLEIKDRRVPDENA